MAMMLIKMQMLVGNNISEPNRCQATCPVDVTESGPRPSRKDQHQKPAQASAIKVKQNTTANAMRDAE